MLSFFIYTPTFIIEPKIESLDESQGFSFYKDKIIFDAPNTCSLIPKRIEMDIELKI